MKKTVYLFDELTGEFLQEFNAPQSPLEQGRFLEPVYSTEIKPPENLPEKTRHFIGGKWIFQAVPPLAEPEAEPTPNQKRRAEILGELERIDIESVRPSRSIALALATGVAPHAKDVDALKVRESNAVALRVEMAALG